MNRFAAVAALSASFALVLAGCSSATTPSSPGTAPGDELAAAVAKTTGTNLTIEVSDSTGDHFFGSYDSTSHTTALVQAPGGAGVTIVASPTDYYLTGPKAPKGETWRLTIDKLRDESHQTLLTDVLTPIALLTKATGVRSTKPGTFTGHVDATLLTGATPGTRKFLNHVLKAGGADAKTLAFTATVDAHGYLSGVKTTFPGLASGADVVFGLKLSDFGATVSVTVPTGSAVVDAPATAYTTI